LPEEDIHTLGYAAFLHDIGKIELDRDLLNKVGALSSEEWELLKQHSQWGSDIVKAVKKLHTVVPIILYHHENYDGSGYPYGLKGTDIPILARIIRVADSYDAMISHRAYKKHISPTEALQELEDNAGTQFDAEIVRYYIDILKEEILADRLNNSEIKIACNS
jgi:HD-GYP domain-containing protein (c-di-GMP phosphodiesterase class II)